MLSKIHRRCTKFIKRIISTSIDKNSSTRKKQTTLTEDIGIGLDNIINDEAQTHHEGVDKDSRAAKFMPTEDG